MLSACLGTGRKVRGGGLEKTGGGGEQIHARAECTMNEKFCILHEASGASCSIENFEFIVHLASACICKQNLTVSNTFNI